MLTLSDQHKNISEVQGYFEKLKGHRVENLYRISNLSIADFVSMTAFSPDDFFCKTDGAFILELSSQEAIGFNKDESTGELICWIDKIGQPQFNGFGSLLEKYQDDVLQLPEVLLSIFCHQKIKDISFIYKNTSIAIISILLENECTIEVGAIGKGYSAELFGVRLNAKF